MIWDWAVLWNRKDDIKPTARALHYLIGRKWGSVRGALWGSLVSPVSSNTTDPLNISPSQAWQKKINQSDEWDCSSLKTLNWTNGFFNLWRVGRVGLQSALKTGKWYTHRTLLFYKNGAKKTVSVPVASSVQQSRRSVEPNRCDEDVGGGDGISKAPSAARAPHVPAVASGPVRCLWCRNALIRPESLMNGGWESAEDWRKREGNFWKWLLTHFLVYRAFERERPPRLLPFAPHRLRPYTPLPLFSVSLLAHFWTFGALDQACSCFFSCQGLYLLLPLFPSSGRASLVWS